MANATTAHEADHDIDLPGLKLHHDIEMDLPHWNAWEAASSRLRESGAEFASTRVARRDGRVIARCRVTGIGSASARSLAGEIETTFGGRLLGLEHLYLSAAGEGG